MYEGDLIEFKLEYTIDGQQLGKMENGVPIEKIHLHFNFLKYCTITYEQANTKINEYEKLIISLKQQLDDLTS